MMKTRILSFILVLALLLSCLPGVTPRVLAAGGFLSSGESSVAKLTPPEIRALLANNPTTTPSDVFEQAPSCSAPYAPGKLTSAARNQVVNRLNALRQIAGLPGVACDETLCEEAQYGAVLLGASEFSHQPSKPADMSQDFYEKGYAATSSSNIYAGLALGSTPDGFMADSDSSNISRVGHRRWQLNPRMGKVGFGYAYAPESAYRFYTAEKVFDRSRTPGDYDMIAWPASGWFPADWMSGWNDTAWSVSLNPNKYTIPAANQLKVTMTRSEDGKTWTFSQAACAGNSFSGSQFYVSQNSNSYIGEGDCIIFRPENGMQYRGTYTVRISGLRDSSGNSAEIAYQVRFFDLEPEKFSDVSASAWYAEAVGWAVDCGVTSGTGGGKFSPKNTCTRAQVVTFLWNAAGKPEPSSANNPFSDVKSGKYYTKAVLWAVEKGITKGLSDTKFGVNEACTRGQVVTFLWRFAGEPAPKTSQSPFTDLKPGASYYKAALWAVEQGITKGTTASTFNPARACDRATIVTFLFRFLGWGAGS